MSIQSYLMESPLQTAEPTETAKVSRKDSVLDAKIRDVENALAGNQIKQGVFDSWRIEWLEQSSNRLQSMWYKGKRVWFIDAEYDFPTAREAIDYGISQYPIVAG